MTQTQVFVCRPCSIAKARVGIFDQHQPMLCPYCGEKMVRSETPQDQPMIRMVVGTVIPVLRLEDILIQAAQDRIEDAKGIADARAIGCAFEGLGGYPEISGILDQVLEMPPFSKSKKRL